jgi:plasmid stabilization system protein ParE
MAYKLIVSKEAHRDIDEIVTYISQQLQNPSNNHYKE